MKIIKSSASIIDTKNPFIKIETVGRTCYKSKSEFNIDTAKKFYNSLVSRKHTAMLEHAVFVFQVDKVIFDSLRGHKYFNYSCETFYDGTKRFLISANLRAINESKENILLSVLNKIDPDLVYYEGFINIGLPDSCCKAVDIDNIPDIQERAYRTHKYFTFRFICDRGVSHEIVRHRPASYAQESTRYCNYSKEQFGRELTFIEPAKYDEWNEINRGRFKCLMT